MGAYLSQPKTDKLSSDELNNYLIVGASSMQGWRNSQEVTSAIKMIFVILYILITFSILFCLRTLIMLF